MRNMNDGTICVSVKKGKLTVNIEHTLSVSDAIKLLNGVLGILKANRLTVKTAGGEQCQRIN